MFRDVAVSATSFALRRRRMTPALPAAIASAPAGPKNAAAPSAGIGVTVPGVPITWAVSGPSKPAAKPATATIAAPIIATTSRRPAMPSVPVRARFAYAAIATKQIARTSAYCQR